MLMKFILVAGDLCCLLFLFKQWQLPEEKWRFIHKLLVGVVKKKKLKNSINLFETSFNYRGKYFNEEMKV